MMDDADCRNDFAGYDGGDVDADDDCYWWAMARSADVGVGEFVWRGIEVDIGSQCRVAAC